MRGVLGRAGTLLRDLGNGASFDDEGVGGLPREPDVRLGPRRFFSLKEYLAPSVVAPSRADFLSAPGRCASKLALSDVQKRVISTCGGGVLRPFEEDSQGRVRCRRAYPRGGLGVPESPPKLRLFADCRPSAVVPLPSSSL